MHAIRPPALARGDTLGIFTPSLPANVLFRAKYEHGLDVIRGLGFCVVEGALTRRCVRDGYRSGTPEERAQEFMALVRAPEVKGLIATMGGANSSSLIPFLDFDEIAANPKVICGYSDITALHLAILARAGLRTFYGPAVVTSFAEWPGMLAETRDSFLQAVRDHRSGRRDLEPPARWSNHFRDARTEAWKTEPRKYYDNPGWRALRRGEARAPVIVANLETLLAAAGTSDFPALDGKILVVEELNARLSLQERAFRQLERMGVFDAIVGLVVGKAEFLDAEGASFGYDELIVEVVGARRSYPIVTGFDCGHTQPMLTIAEMTPVHLFAGDGFEVRLTVEEPMVDG